MAATVSGRAGRRYVPLLYLLRAASPWRLPPRDFPNRLTVQRYSYDWQAAGLLETINFLLLQQVNERAEREVSPSAGVIPGSSPGTSQTAKTTESGGLRGFDAGQEHQDRKRHIRCRAGSVGGRSSAHTTSAHYSLVKSSCASTAATVGPRPAAARTLLNIRRGAAVMWQKGAVYAEFRGATVSSALYIP